MNWSIVLLVVIGSAALWFLGYMMGFIIGRQKGADDMIGELQRQAHELVNNLEEAVESGEGEPIDIKGNYIN